MASKAPKMLSFYLATGLFGAFVTGQMSDPANDAQIIIGGWTSAEACGQPRVSLSDTSLGARKKRADQ